MASSTATPDFNKALYAPLGEIDPEVQNIIDKETWRQYSGLELIASENLTSRATMEANGSILTNKYSEGLPNARYYGGNEWIDELELLCRKRALEAFHLDPAQWGVNVQPYSGSTANFAALTALLQPQDRLMGLGLPDGGHLTHGYYTAKKKMTASSIYFQSLPYGLDPQTQLIDYEGLAKHARLFKPRLLICGASAYPRDWDYAALRKTADEHGAYLMADIAHTSGLIAAQELNDPFAYCDVVTTTTHKTLRGPRAGLIFFRKDGEKNKDLEKRVNDAVFPACQAAHTTTYVLSSSVVSTVLTAPQTIAGIAVALLQASQPSWKAYAKQVVSNAGALADELVKEGYKLQTGGTDNHLVLWDLRPLGLTGSKVEKVGDLLGITINKNAVSGDTNARGRAHGRALPAPQRAARAAPAEGGGLEAAEGLFVHAERDGEVRVTGGAREAQCAGRAAAAHLEQVLLLADGPGAAVGEVPDALLDEVVDILEGEWVRLNSICGTGALT
ncbi:hypothetical protein EWM64_g6380 [Hericium alpestre]|uniref:Serine hydroxymethyltransferase n=1 Tax=Hericium alpestre TaxID=135208 RepID=A0A4Y9ZS69_9AGAM|nr:hypothetical protein EWM64_g6380 [Hericium alpestre]